ncbi:MAG TPA: helix-turn-helix domain-containing protein, partial [Phycisphaerae bacterium]|nr:helix-turn-helix domain-containing protein [Phycisphaerae bacterium]
VEALLDFFLERFAAEYGQSVRYIAPEIRETLRTYGWPGNVRELSCWVERLYAANLPPVPPTNEMWDDQYVYAAVPAQPAFAEAQPAFSFAASPATVSAAAPAATNASLEQAETETIRSVLAQCDGNRSRAADMLNIHRTTLIRKIKQYGL